VRYFRPLSTCMVTTRWPEPSRPAMSSAAARFAPVEGPEKMPSSRAAWRAVANAPGSGSARPRRRTPAWCGSSHLRTYRTTRSATGSPSPRRRTPGTTRCFRRCTHRRAGPGAAGHRPQPPRSWPAPSGPGMSRSDWPPPSSPQTSAPPSPAIRASRTTGVSPIADSPPGRSIPPPPAQNSRQQPTAAATPTAPIRTPARCTHLTLTRAPSRAGVMAPASLLGARLR
jgi:hypothetical protein